MCIDWDVSKWKILDKRERVEEIIRTEAKKTDSGDKMNDDGNDVVLL